MFSVIFEKNKEPSLLGKNCLNCIVYNICVYYIYIIINILNLNVVIQKSPFRLKEETFYQK